MKKWWGAAFLTALGGWLYAAVFERLWLELIQTELELPDHKLASGPLRILQLSDLHLDRPTAIQNAKIKRTLQLIGRNPHYDLILLTGDMIETDAGIEPLGDLLAQLPPACFGTYACLGNHDYAQYSLSFQLIQAANRGIQALLTQIWFIISTIVFNDSISLASQQNDVVTLEKMLHQHNVCLLVNEGKAVTPNLWLSAVDDWMDGKPDVDKTVADIPQNGLHLLLTHNPDAMLAGAMQQFDVAFAGHVHGGQIRLPFWGALYTQGTHLPANRTAGWFNAGGCPFYVSKGWGESTPLRFNCRPEITIISLSHENRHAQ